MRNHLIPSAIALAAALSATPALARPMTEVDMATMYRVAAPAASHDGRWLVYQVTETAPETYTRSTALWNIDRTTKSGKPDHTAHDAGQNESYPPFGAAARSVACRERVWTAVQAAVSAIPLNPHNYL